MSKPEPSTRQEAQQAPLLGAEGLRVRYGPVTAVHAADIVIPASPTRIGLIGESGSGKTTILRALLGLVRPASGAVRYRGTVLQALHGAARAEFRNTVQPVFQDGNEALDPRMRIATSIAEGLRRPGNRAERRDRIASLLDDVGLAPELAQRYPHQLSGGQRQRVIIARALAAEPSLLLLDEPTSALDVLVQDRILRLLERLCAERRLSLLLVTHNLAVASRLCDTAHVMHRGRIVESGSMRRILADPTNDYTRALVRAVPTLMGRSEGPVTR